MTPSVSFEYMHFRHTYMSDRKIIIKNISIQTIGEIINLVFGLIYISLISRYLGPTEYGKYAFVLTFLYFVNIINNIGLKPIIIREASADPSKEREIIGVMTGLKVFLAVISYIVAVIAVNFMNVSGEMKQIICFGALTLLLSPIQSLSMIFEIKLKMMYVVLAETIQKIISITLVLIFISHKLSIFYFVLNYLISTIVLSVCFFFFSQKYVKFQCLMDLDKWIPILKYAVPLGVASIFGIIYFKIDAIMLFKMKGEYAVGIYDAAYRLFEKILIIPQIIMTTIFPVLSRLYHSDHAKCDVVIQKTINYLAIFGFMVGISLCVASNDIIHLFYGTAFQESTLCLAILALSCILIFICYIYGTLLIILNKQNLQVVIAILAASLNIWLNYLVIPKYSYFGASAATLITEIFVLVLSIVLVKRFMKLNINFLILLKIFTIALVSFGLVYFSLGQVNFILKLILCGLIYIWLLINFKIIETKELKFT